MRIVTNFRVLLSFFHKKTIKRPLIISTLTSSLSTFKSLLCFITGTEFNFNKYDRSKTDSLETPYDYGSVMHYDSKAFSRNGRPTIVAREPGVGFVLTLIIEPL